MFVRLPLIQDPEEQQAMLKWLKEQCEDAHHSYIRFDHNNEYLEYGVDFVLDTDAVQFKLRWC